LTTTHKVITTLDEFLKLEQAWNELVANSEVDHAFMKHQWFAELIQAYGLERSLSIIAIWSDSQLVAVAPICRRSFAFRITRAKDLPFLASHFTPRVNFITADLALVAELMKHLLQL